MKSTKKLIPAIAMLLVSAVVLTSASYAWFTMSKDVEAQNMKLTITAPTNLLISNVSNGTYGTTTDLTDKGIIDEAGAVTKLYPASSWDGNTFTAIEENANDGVPLATTKYYTENATYAAGLTNDSIDDMGFYKDYMVYLKTTGDKYVTVAVNEDAAVTKITADNTTDDEATKCVRMAVVAQQQIGTAGDNADWLTTTYTTAGSSKTQQFFDDATSTKITASNVISQADCFGTQNNSETDEVNAVVGPMKYTAGATPAWSTYTGTVDATNLIGADPAAIIIVAPNNAVTAVLIRVWFEGQSDFCSHEIADAEVEMNLGFKTIAESATAPTL